jgi:CHRD domain
MLKLLKLFVVVLAAAALALLVTPVANAQERTTFVAQLSAENEIPGCPEGVESGAGGVAVVQIDEASGEISYRVAAFDLPGTVRPQGLGAHIYIGDATQAGGVVYRWSSPVRPPALWPLGRRPTRLSPPRFSSTRKTTTSSSTRRRAKLGRSGGNWRNTPPICRARCRGTIGP